MDNRDNHKKCEFIIRQFMDMEDCPPELSARFHEWLFDGRDCKEKDKVVRKLFEEALDKQDRQNKQVNQDSRGKQGKQGKQDKQNSQGKQDKQNGQGKQDMQNDQGKQGKKKSPGNGDKQSKD